MNAPYQAWREEISSSPAPARTTQLLNLAALLLIATSPLWLYLLLVSGEDYFDYSSALLLLPPILIVHAGLVVAVSRRDGHLRRVMLVGSLAKLASASVFLYLAFHVYDMSVDALHYFYQGKVYLNAVSANGGWLVLQPFWSNNFIYMISGALQYVIGPSLQTATVIFALASFWGEYFFYRAFCTAAPGADRGQVGLLLFLFPSLVFWTACIGKDAAILFAIGLTAYGLAKLSQHFVVAGTLLVTTGMAGVLLIRPHVAVMFATACVLPLLLAKSHKGIAGMLGRVLGLPLLIVVTLYLSISAKDFLQVEDFSHSGAVLQKVSASNSYGGSAFGRNAGLGQRVLAAPVLFLRPFPWEVRNAQSAIAALEGLLLATLMWKRRKQLGLVLKNWRENPFVFFLLLFVTEFSIIFSAAITNFGLLARQRVMAMPFLLMLLCLRGAQANEWAGSSREFFAAFGAARALRASAPRG